MPDRIYVRGCGTGCLRCWRNHLKHANKESKAYMKKHPEMTEYDIDSDSEEDFESIEHKMRAAFRRITKQSYLGSPSAAEVELVDRLSQKNRKKRLQRKADAVIPRPNRRTRKMLMRNQTD